jgi:hypothetical protein
MRSIALRRLGPQHMLCPIERRSALLVSSTVDASKADKNLRRGKKAESGQEAIYSGRFMRAGGVRPSDATLYKGYV